VPSSLRNSHTKCKMPVHAAGDDGQGATRLRGAAARSRETSGGHAIFGHHREHLAVSVADNFFPGPRLYARSTVEQHDIEEDARDETRDLRDLRERERERGIE
jgi:hypothetical protein